MTVDPQPVTPTVTSTKVLRRFRVVFNAVRTHFRQIEKQAGLGGAQVWALSLIQDHPGIGMGGIAKNMDIHQSTASNLIKTLLRKELISMDKSAHDKRSVHLHILPTGRTLLANVSAPFEGVLPAALQKLDAATLARLDADIGELIALLNVDEAAEETPLADI